MKTRTTHSATLCPFLTSFHVGKLLMATRMSHTLLSILLVSSTSWSPVMMSRRQHKSGRNIRLQRRLSRNYTDMSKRQRLKYETLHSGGKLTQLRLCLFLTCLYIVLFGSLFCEETPIQFPIKR